MNSLYNVIFHQRRVVMKPEVGAYKTQMKVFVPRFSVTENDRVSMSCEVVQDWFFKNGKLKRQDVHNMSKVLVDLVAEKMGFDDSQVWSFTMTKTDSKTEACVKFNLTATPLLPQGS
jgi:Holliday junction resolvase RusA-like endonuclease